MCTAWIQIVHSQHRITEFWWLLNVWKEENIVLFEHFIHEPGFLARWVFMSWSGTWLNTVPSFIGHGPCFLLVTALFSYGPLGTCMVDVFWTQTLDDSILKVMIICVHLQDSNRAMKSPPFCSMDFPARNLHFVWGFCSQCLVTSYSFRMFSDVLGIYYLFTTHPSTFPCFSIKSSSIPLEPPWLRSETTVVSWGPTGTRWWICFD